MRAQLPILVATIAACNQVDLPRHFEQTEQASTVCATGTIISGIDVSAYQQTVDWNAVVADSSNNIKFAYAKATEGYPPTNCQYADVEFPTYWPAMKSAGIIRGAYHFFHSSCDGKAQADYFLGLVNAAGGFAAGDLPPMLDWETSSMDSGGTSAEAVSNAQKFIDEIMAKTGMKTIIYTGPGSFNALVGTSQFASDPLWNASWPCDFSSSVCADTSTCAPGNCHGLPPSSDCPDLPSNWSSWVMWQWTDDLQVAGIAAADYPDGDVFNGSLADLQAWIASTTGMPADAGFPVDAGAREDAGSIDSGGDAGSRVGTPIVDGGAYEIPQADGGATTKPASGCGCSPGGSPDAMLWLGLAFVKSRFRRKRTV